MPERMAGEEEMMPLLTTALSIISIDEFLYPGAYTAIVWVDLSDRPDLHALCEQGELNRAKRLTCTWSYLAPGTENMRLGLRITMHEPSHLMLSLVFSLEYFYNQLVTISLDGNLWIVPGPTPDGLTALLTGDDMTALSEYITAYRGQGLFVTLDHNMVEELIRQLMAWKEWKRTTRLSKPGER